MYCIMLCVSVSYLPWFSQQTYGSSWAQFILLKFKLPPSLIPKQISPLSTWKKKSHLTCLNDVKYNSLCNNMSLNLTKFFSVCCGCFVCFSKELYLSQMQKHMIKNDEKTNLFVVQWLRHYCQWHFKSYTSGDFSQLFSITFGWS